MTNNRTLRILLSLGAMVVLAGGTSADGTGERPRALREISIPTVDISGETDRHVIVARGTKQLWQGHPNTVLMPDGKTMFCSWQGRRDSTRKHGAPGGLLKRSDDGGLTWSGLLDVPANWRDVGRGHPTIHRLVDSGGVGRLFVFQRTPDRGSMLQAISEDGGATWSPMRKNQLICWTAPQTVLPVENGRKHLMWYERSRDGAPRPGVIWQSASRDGGLTWGNSEPVVDFAGASEPAVLRAPDGSQLLLLIRENSRRYNSLYATSDNEGQAWTEPRQLPRALTGDRHDGVYTPDGRLVIVFRGQAKGAATYGQFVAWVGRYEDIVAGREGEYRVKLLHSHADTGYPGIEILPDGTIVATTYAQLRRDELSSVVSVRFTIDELDDKLNSESTPPPGDEG